ncbi:RNA polymerase sigma factor [Streptomyces nigrescens]
MTQREQAATAFDDLHTRHAAALMQQAYLLTGRAWLARRAVERGFRLAWQRWPEVAVDPDPAGWVRAAVYEYALTPWHQLCPGLRTARGPRKPSRAAGPSDGALPAALLSLPAPYRRALLLHDGVGLGPAATAAEIEASAPAAAGRLTHARERIAALLPQLGLDGQPPERQGEILRARLSGPLSAAEVTPRAAAHVRSGSERSARRTTRAAFGATGLFALVTLVMMALAPDHSTPPPKRPLATAPHTRVSPARHHGADTRERRNAARERRNAAREQGNAAVRKKLREARLAPDLR